MQISLGWISGLNVGVEFIWDLDCMFLDLGIVRVGLFWGNDGQQ